MKAFLDIPPGLRLCYRIDDYTDPWRTPASVILVHGFGESGAVWRPWVPHLARRYRVIRIDQRGFGESSAMPEDFAWSLDVLVDDLEQVVDRLGGGPVHLVAAKVAGPVIMRFAAMRPDRTRSITLAGSMSKGPPGTDEWCAHIREHGMEHWARTTMPPRLGSAMSAEAIEWWVRLTAATPRSTLGLLRAAAGIDVKADLPHIRCPALVITTDSTRRPAAATRAWQSLIPRSELRVLPGDAYHPAASDADTCARHAMEFMARVDDNQAAAAASATKEFHA